jgi:hypothetical protein
MLNRNQMKSILGGVEMESPKSRGKCCATANGDGYGQNAPSCSECVDNAVSFTLAVLVAC